MRVEVVAQRLRARPSATTSSSKSDASRTSTSRLASRARPKSVNVVGADARSSTARQADFSTNINQTSLANLPINARRWSNFVLITPGAAPDGTFGLISFRGISGLLNNNTVDGGDNTQAFFAEERGRTRLSYSLSVDAVQEFQVTTSNYSAEYGRAAGGVVNAVTKSGAQQVPGDRASISSATTSGARPTRSRRRRIMQNGGSTQRAHRSPMIAASSSASAIGGPIKKDKVFFFFSFDQQKRNFPGTAVPANPTAFFAPSQRGRTGDASPAAASPPAQGTDGLKFLQSLTGVVERTGDQTLLLPKIDWQINDNHSLAVSYNHLRWDSPAGVQTAAVVNRGVDSWGNDGVEGDWVDGRFTSVLGSKYHQRSQVPVGPRLRIPDAASRRCRASRCPPAGRTPAVDITGTAASASASRTSSSGTSYPDERRDPDRRHGSRWLVGYASREVRRRRQPRLTTRWTTCSRKAASTPTAAASTSSATTS